MPPHRLPHGQKHGLLLQIVLSTAHFLRYGYGGESGVLHDVVNRDRVAACHTLLTTREGTESYLRTVLEPLLHAIGRHPAAPTYRRAHTCSQSTCSPPPTPPTVLRPATARC